MAFGKTREEVEAEGRLHRAGAGRASSREPPDQLYRLAELTPHTFGQLIAVYEHKVFTQGAIWNINPFDQWGVEARKGARRRHRPGLERDRSSRSSHHDSSTATLIARYRARR
ncbi:MAG: hypothetical protein U5R31_01230 [Acidimicrobiia bacterium]|nr:hypothetical protein [Acidimicrobiia bacterium]